MKKNQSDNLIRARLDRELQVNTGSSDVVPKPNAKPARRKNTEPTTRTVHKIGPEDGRSYHQAFSADLALYKWVAHARLDEDPEPSMSEFVSRALYRLRDEGIPDDVDASILAPAAERRCRQLQLDSEIVRWLKQESGVRKTDVGRGGIRTISDIICYAIWREREIRQAE